MSKAEIKTKKYNEKDELSPFLMCEDYDAYLENMSKTELLEYFHFVVDNYRHSLDDVTLENIELQKQVDELKIALKNVIESNEELIEECEQSIKDRAKEIYLWLDEKDKRGMTVPFNMVLRQLKEQFCVEVE